MYIINSFLQKTKLHESHHGFFMVITAYVLSALLLILGSDMFYGIITKAEKISIDSYEATQKATSRDIIDPYKMESDTIPFAVSTGSVSAIESSNLTADTNWLLGTAMNQEEYHTLIENMDKIASANAVELGADTVSEEKSIESFSTLDKSNKLKYYATEDEVKMLERIVEAEASGEDLVGRILIVNVIINRLEDEEFPDSIEDVIFQKAGGEYQFSPVKDKRYWDVKVSKKTKQAVQKALEGEDYSDGALYFIARKRTKSSRAKWFDDNLDWLFKHGGHDFFRNK